MNIWSFGLGVETNRAALLTGNRVQFTKVGMIQLEHIISPRASVASPNCMAIMQWRRSTHPGQLLDAGGLIHAVCHKTPDAASARDRLNYTIGFAFLVAVLAFCGRAYLLLSILLSQSPRIPQRWAGRACILDAAVCPITRRCGTQSRSGLPL